MGCDIHVFAEIKVNGKWLLYSQPRIRRWYQLFGKMAGVRDDSQTPILPPKGLPKDISEGTALEAKWWSGDGHSHSWFNQREIHRLYYWVEENFHSRKTWDWEYEQVGYLHGNSWNDFYRYNEDYPEDIEDIRWVFWFDN